MADFMAQIPHDNKFMKATLRGGEVRVVRRNKMENHIRGWHPVRMITPEAWQGNGKWSFDAEHPNDIVKLEPIEFAEAHKIYARQSENGPSDVD